MAPSALSVVSRVEIENNRIRSDYLQRARVLEQLLSDIYLSGTYVRDFLLENEDQRAEVYRNDFFRARRRIEDAIGKYHVILRPEEAGVFDALTKGISAYFGALEPALEWNAEQRRIRGRVFIHGASVAVTHGDHAVERSYDAGVVVHGLVPGLFRSADRSLLLIGLEC